jgi:hypothetical protein
MKYLTDVLCGFVRRAILGLWDRKLLHYVEESDVVVGYLEYLEKQVVKRNYAPSEYLLMRQAFIDNQMTLRAEATQSSDGEMGTIPSATRDVA